MTSPLSDRAKDPFWAGVVIGVWAGWIQKENTRARKLERTRGTTEKQNSGINADAKGKKIPIAEILKQRFSFPSAAYSGTRAVG
jgi:hypothetical protein